MSLPVSVAADELLLLTVTGDAAAAAVTATGEVDSFSAPRLAAALDIAISRTAHTVSVDLAGVTFLDCAGVNALAAAYRCATSAGIGLRVSAEHRAVRRPLQLTGLWPLLGTDPEPSGTTPVTSRRM